MAAASREQDPEKELMHLHTTDKGSFKAFPPGRGPHQVGCVDIMTQGLPKCSVFGRIFYPTDFDTSKHPERWVDYFEDIEYVKGLQQFKNSLINNWPSWAPHSDMKNLSLTGLILPLLPERLYLFGFRMLFDNLKIMVAKRSPLKESSEPFPVVVFSHGLGCSRFLYSQICNDIASFGFVVAAVEHRDGSACRSRYYDGKMNWINHKTVRENEYKIRNKQVNTRSQECSMFLDLLTDLNEGRHVIDVSAEGMKADGQEDLEPLGFSWSMFKGKLAVDKPYIMGHSFGGATTVLTLANDHRFKIGACLDPWMFPLKEENLNWSIVQPLLFINTHTFLNFENLREQAKYRNGCNNATRQSYYIKGSIHQNHADMSIAVRNKSIREQLGMESVMDPLRFIEINDNLVLQFLWRESLNIKHPEIDKQLEAEDAEIVNNRFRYKGAPYMIDLDYMRMYSHSYDQYHRKEYVPDYVDIG